MAVERHVFARSEMEQPQILSLSGGHVVVFSTRSPAKQTDNEDVAAVITTNGSLVLVVADGMGGQPGGEAAADLIVEHLTHALSDRDQDSPLRSAILTGLDAANRAVLDMGVGAGATAAIAEVTGDSVRAYHVGDAVALLAGQRGRVRFQTAPHTPVGYAIEAGILNELEAMRQSNRHVVSNAVGSPDMRIDVGPQLAMKPRDTLLLGSDGLLDNLTTTEVVDNVRCGPLDRAGRELAAGTLERMKHGHDAWPAAPDDLTFILFRMS